MQKLLKPRGTQDILPQDQKYRDFIWKIFEKKMVLQGFEKIETPIFERAEVFARPIGENSDIVQKQMFEVSRLGSSKNDNEEKLVLRPDYTAGIIRSYLETGFSGAPQPFKLYYAGPLFRYERPQKGRQRQFTQFGFEVIGDSASATDALTIYTVWDILKSLKILKLCSIEINTVGCELCKPDISEKLQNFFNSFKKMLCGDCKKRINNNNPLRILDCKEKTCQKIASSSPDIIDMVCENCKTHFSETLEFLDELNVSYDLNPKLVRGLDYYTRTTFEVVIKNVKERQSSLAGGGRYDRLAKTLGGKKTSAIGMSFGVERIIEFLKENNIDAPETSKPQVMLIQLGPKARKKTLKLMTELIKKGIKSFIAPGKESLKSQLHLADKKKIRFVLIVGEREVFDKSVIVKDMERNSQESINDGRLINKLKSKIKN
ncbi:MAG: histidyl-tRNA synthetase [Candidatus Berkelbacteria bacterium Licking1014_7]|uniref:Histidine--tRNA ligase n=1 Tax=Candidatus Berkelbacteria bacterium Licking1014_7 TaxID=2017147 RepID=A0A554LIG5_9BACT|nr:MAG: histidyl-tRNA synthetase [Candidatus Berkelbacteria bacterium Licking1014_7]